MATRRIGPPRESPACATGLRGPSASIRSGMGIGDQVLLRRRGDEQEGQGQPEPEQHEAEEVSSRRTDLCLGDGKSVSDALSRLMTFPEQAEIMHRQAGFARAPGAMP